MARRARRSKTDFFLRRKLGLADFLCAAKPAARKRGRGQQGAEPERRTRRPPSEQARAAYSNARHFLRLAAVLNPATACSDDADGGSTMEDAIKSTAETATQLAYALTDSDDREKARIAASLSREAEILVLTARRQEQGWRANERAPVHERARAVRDFWVREQRSMPQLFQLYTRTVIMMPSNSAIERVFARLRQNRTAQQNRAGRNTFQSQALSVTNNHQRRLARQARAKAQAAPPHLELRRDADVLAGRADNDTAARPDDDDVDDDACDLLTFGVGVGVDDDDTLSGSSSNDEQESSTTSSGSADGAPARKRSRHNSNDI